MGTIAGSLLAAAFCLMTLAPYAPNYHGNAKVAACNRLEKDAYKQQKNSHGKQVCMADCDKRKITCKPIKKH